MIESCANYRSAVPDLLFQDICDARIADIRPYLETPELVDGEVSLHRLTVFLTYRCNLACPYCKTIARTAEELGAFPQKAETFTLASFRSLLDSYADSPIQHLHFTGGEATLVGDLPQMVALARSRGIPNVSLTSNGTRGSATFAALVDSGINEIRLSIDARDPDMGAALSGRPRAWSAAVSNLHALVALRSTTRSFFVIANTVVTEVNRHETADIVRFLISIGVDDVKLITAVDEKDTLGRFPGAVDVLRSIDQALAPHPADAFPLLRRKLRTVFAPDSIGLAGLTEPRRDDWRCYIPLTERTADVVFYYPCSVYLREGGQPIGRVGEPADVQRAKTANFVRHGRCLDDSICRTYCLHCTKAFNVAANDARLTGRR